VRVTRLAITPVKGTGLHHPAAIDLRRWGAVGDRAFVVVDERGRVVSLPRTGAFAGLRARHDGDLAFHEGDALLCRGPVALAEAVRVEAHAGPVPGRVVAGPWTALLSQRAGRPVRLVKLDEPGAGNDVAPVTLVGTASLARLAERVGAPVDARRFRMLVELETDVPHAEDEWRGRRLRGEEVELVVGLPVPRCAAITRHPDRGDRDQPLVRAIRDDRGTGPSGVPFGVYAEVVREGRLRVGEELVLSSSG